MNIFPLLMVGLSSTLVFFSNSWGLIWLLMEINSFSFVILIILSMKSKVSIKYFLIQSIASAIYLISILWYLNLQKIIFFVGGSLSSNLLLFSMIMKLGMFPFFSWVLLVGVDLNFFMFLIFLTWQKLIPLLIFLKMKLNSMVFLVALISFSLGVILQFNCYSLKMILILSSISHLGFMLLISSYSSFSSLIYLLYYTFLFLLIMEKMKNWLQDKNISSLNLTIKEQLFLMFLIMSISGLPPFIGFFVKWFILKSMVNFYSVLNITILVLISCLSFFIYNRMIFKINLFFFKSEKNLSKALSSNYLFISCLNVFPILFFIF